MFVSQDRLTIQLSPRSLFTNHRVIWPAAWITSRLQKPSPTWNTGVLYRSTLSHVPIVIISMRPSTPNSHSYTSMSWARFPPKVRSTHPELLSASMENLLRLHINIVGIMSHCVAAKMLHIAHRNLESSGVASRRTE
jgi:hypothetical protein